MTARVCRYDPPPDLKNYYCSKWEGDHSLPCSPGESHYVHTPLRLGKCGEIFLFTSFWSQVFDERVFSCSASQVRSEALTQCGQQQSGKRGTTGLFLAALAMFLRVCIEDDSSSQTLGWLEARSGDSM